MSAVLTFRLYCFINGGTCLYWVWGLGWGCVFISGRELQMVENWLSLN